jgi:hypothetical protein
MEHSRLPGLGPSQGFHRFDWYCMTILHICRLVNNESQPHRFVVKKLRFMNGNGCFEKITSGKTASSNPWLLFQTFALPHSKIPN